MDNALKYVAYLRGLKKWRRLFGGLFLLCATFRVALFFINPREANMIGRMRMIVWVDVVATIGAFVAHYILLRLEVRGFWKPLDLCESSEPEEDAPQG